MTPLRGSAEGCKYTRKQFQLAPTRTHAMRWMATMLPPPHKMRGHAPLLANNPAGERAVAFPVSPQLPVLPAKACE
jgi:hypothetical protein